MRLRTRHFGLAALVMLVAALAPTPASAAGNTSLVASGFSSPRGVVFFHGQLLVAEGGVRGPYCNGLPPPALLCIGNSGQISRVNTKTGAHTPLISGLFAGTENHGGPDELLGSEGLSISGGRVLNILGLYPQVFDGIKCASGDSACAQTLALARAQAGHLISVGMDGSLRVGASVGAFGFDFTANIPNQEHDSNPYAVLAANGGAYVADAGSNTLNFVSSRGRIKVLNYFPFRQAGFPTDEVPDCVVRANGALYVGTLSGHLYRIGEDGATPVSVPLLKHVTGCASDENGNLFLVNMWTTAGPPGPDALFTGNIVKFDAEEGTSSVVAAGINFPNMDTIGPDGNLYVSADSVCPATGLPFCTHGGTVWKVKLPSEDNHQD
jgi:hypothetical protein